MAVALKEELHRLVDEIPDTRPEVARVLFELAFLLLFASSNDEALFDRFLQDVAEARGDSDDRDQLLARLEALRNRWVHGPREVVDALPRPLELAPDDDEPLTSEEAAMLDARRAAVATGPTIPHDEVGRKIREVGRKIRA
jgi:hypothetical protein